MQNLKAGLHILPLANRKRNANSASPASWTLRIDMGLRDGFDRAMPQTDMRASRWKPNRRLNVVFAFFDWESFAGQIATLNEVVAAFRARDKKD